MRTVVLDFHDVPDEVSAEDLANDPALWSAAGVTISPYPPSENVGGR